MADVLNVSFKVDTSGLEADAAAAGKLAAAGFQQGFGSVDLKTPMAKAAEAAQKQAAAIGAALQGAAVGPHAAPAAPAAEPIAHRAPAMPTHGEESEAGGTHHEGHEPKLSGFENAVRGIGAMRLAFEGLSQFLEKGSLAGAAKTIGEIGERAAESAEKVGLIGEMGLKIGGVATAVAGMAHFLGKEAGEYSEDAQEEVLGLDATTKMSGMPTERLLGLKELVASKGAEARPLMRGLSIMNLRQQQQRAGLERELSEEPLDRADQSEKVAGAYRKREDAADSLATAEEKIIGTRAREAVTLSGAAIRDQIAKERGPMDVVAAALGLGEAQEGQRSDAALSPLNIASAQKRLEMAHLGPEREDLQFAEAKEGVRGAQVNYGTAIIQARAADIADRETHGERVGNAEKQQLRMDAADQASTAAWEHVREAGLAITAAKFHQEEVGTSAGAAQIDIGKALQELIHIQREAVLQQRADRLRVQGAGIGVRTADVTEKEREAAAGAGAGEQGPESLTPEMQRQRGARETAAALRQRAAAGGAIGTAERDAIREEHIQDLQPQTQPGQVAEALAGTYKGKFPIDLKSTEGPVIGKALTAMGQGEKYSGPEGAGTLGALQDVIKRFAEERSMDSVSVTAAKSLFGGRNANPNDESGRSTTAFIRALTLATKEELADAWQHKMTPEETEKFGPENTAAMQKAAAADVIKRQSDEENKVLVGSEATPGATKATEAEGEFGKLVAPFIKDVLGPVSDLIGLGAQAGIWGAKHVAGAITAGNEALSGGVSQGEPVSAWDRAVPADSDKEREERAHTLGKIEALGTTALVGAGGIFAGVKGAQYLYGASGRAFRKWAGTDKGAAEAPAPEAAPEAAPPVEATPVPFEAAPIPVKVVGPTPAPIEAAPATAVAPAPTAAVAPEAATAPAATPTGPSAYESVGGPFAAVLPALSLLQAAQSGLGAAKSASLGAAEAEGPITPAQIEQMKAFAGPTERPAERVPATESGERAPPSAPPAPAVQPAGGSAFASAASAIRAAAGTLSGAGGSLQGAASALQSAASALSAAANSKQAQAPATSGGPATATEEHADGGLISGAGSGASDSNLAWVSHGEYIVKADSVQKLGVPFLDQLNAGKFALGGIVRGFAEGGTVDDDQAKTKAALEALRLKMPLFGRGVFDDPDWATPLGDKIRLEHADKIRPPAEAGGGADEAAAPPSLPMQRAEMWRSRSIRSHPAVEPQSPDQPKGGNFGELSDIKEMADVSVDYGWGNKKTFKVQKSHGPERERGPELAGQDGQQDPEAFALMFGDQRKAPPARARPHQQPHGLETPFESVPAVHADEESHNRPIRIPGAIPVGSGSRSATPDYSNYRWDGGRLLNKSGNELDPSGGEEVHAPHRSRSSKFGLSDEEEIKRDNLSEWRRVHGDPESEHKKPDERYWQGFKFGGLIPGFASGGLARVSNGEYRIGPAAVTKYGARLMEHLNPGRFDDWGNGISRGLSASLPPGISTQDHGGSSQHTLDLVTSAGQFRMHASADTIEAIRASAIGQKLTSAGQKPSWY